MPTSEVPTNVNENEPGGVQGSDPSSGPAQPLQAEPRPDSGSDQALEPGDSQQPRLRGSRWVDYDTHELLEMISELEDERRWTRLREGIWIAILLHILLISAFTWIPKYVFKVPQVIDPIDAIQKRKDLTYLDSVPDAIRELQKPKVVAPAKQTTVDKKTLEALNKPVPPPPTPAPTPPTPQPVAQPAPIKPAPAPLPPTQASQSPVEAPRPAAVPARPSFAMNSDNPADQLREAMRNAERHPGAGGEPGSAGSGSGLPRHPGAGNGYEILSPTNGVDFRAWIERWHHETQSTWDPLIPDEVNPPILKSGMVVIRFRVLPNGRLMEPNGVVLEGRSGDTALDRAAWGALTGSNYPPLPRDFHGPYLEMRVYFMYNMQPPK